MAFSLPGMNATFCMASHETNFVMSSSKFSFSELLLLNAQ
jgi:hypothetical protein